MLYLIPVPIAENALDTLPPLTVDVARRLDFFIVERAKTARHFIKSIQPARPIQEMTFVEMDENDPAEAEAALLEAARTGRDVGLLSEAGCPAVADPGAAIVAAAHRTGIRVEPLVGPSSLLLAIMASGMNGQSFAFHGYRSPKRVELAAELRKLEQLAERQAQTQLFIETPYRSQLVLETALEALQLDTRFAVAQDLTGQNAFIRSCTVAEWRRGQRVQLAKSPAVFLVYRENLGKGGKH